MRVSPFVVGRKVSNDFFETYLHFLKNVNLSMKFGDVLNELIRFQNSLDWILSIYINKTLDHINQLFWNIFIILKNKWFWK